MKTKTKPLFAVVIFAVLGVGFLLGILVNFPKVDQSDVVGTIGKAEKFKKVQMTPKDIQLRSEFLKDTAQLKNMIQGLVYFSLSTDDLSSNIEATLMAFKSKGLGAATSELSQVTALQDYSTFIKNNNVGINSTIEMLTSFYLNNNPDQALDVEKNLRDFGTYVTNLNQKHLVLSQALEGMDNFMLTKLELQAQKDDLLQLKSLRDQLLVKGVQLGSLLNNRDQVGALLLRGFASQEKLGVLIMGKEQLGVLLGSEKLSRILSKEQLGLFLGKEQLNVIWGNEKLSGGFTAGFTANAGNGLSIFYDKESLQFLAGNSGQLGSLLNADSKLNILAIWGNEKLNIYGVNYSMLNILQSQLVSCCMASSSLGILFSTNNLQAINFSNLGLSSLLNFLANEKLGAYI